ncbi:hypothetical protein ACFOMD_16410 [Sphingoaurantiacus capsulatus]|uniref:Uncharacterized protein n=1 Tax=Sphingoaurantiacus capsulatus TaxID=1771310 RepID=A0ABV7XFC1_9SPHN
MAKRFLSAAAAFGALLLLGAAQTAPGDEEITVKGQRLTPAQARERAIAYVHATGIVAGKEAVARWVDKVCPRIIGLSAEHAAVVEARFRSIAGSVGAPLAAKGCAANVTINFVGDGRAFTKNIAVRDGRRLGEVPYARRAALINGEAPIRWWYLTELRSRDGKRMFGMDPSFVAADGQAAGQALPNNGESSMMTQYSSSHVSTQINRTLVSATVVVDTNRATGATLDAVAAHAAYVALAEIQALDEPLDGSILGLFGDAPPRGLTKLDEAFLRELYALPLDRKARQQRTRLVRALQAQTTTF